MRRYRPRSSEHHLLDASDQSFESFILFSGVDLLTLDFMVGKCDPRLLYVAWSVPSSRDVKRAGKPCRILECSEFHFMVVSSLENCRISVPLLLAGLKHSRSSANDSDVS